MTVPTSRPVLRFPAWWLQRTAWPLAAVEALALMEQRKITSLVVAEGNPKRAVGVVHLHDLWRTGMV